MENEAKVLKIFASGGASSGAPSPVGLERWGSHSELPHLATDMSKKYRYVGCDDLRYIYLYNIFKCYRYTAVQYKKRFLVSKALTTPKKTSDMISHISFLQSKNENRGISVYSSSTVKAGPPMRRRWCTRANTIAFLGGCRLIQYQVMSECRSLVERQAILPALYRGTALFRPRLMLGPPRYCIGSMCHLALMA